MQFSTVYFLPARYETTLYARDLAHAHELIGERGMREMILREYPHPVLLPSDHIYQWNFASAIHSSCWLGMIACKSRSVSGFDMMHDQGLLHLVAHLGTQRKEDLTVNLTDKRCWMILSAYWTACELEQITPGFSRCPGDEIVLEETAPVGMIDLAKRVQKYVPDWYATNCPFNTEYATLIPAQTGSKRGSHDETNSTKS
jgi:hypothetical protein